MDRKELFGHLDSMNEEYPYLEAALAVFLGQRNFDGESRNCDSLLRGISDGSIPIVLIVLRTYNGVIKRIIPVQDPILVNEEVYTSKLDSPMMRSWDSCAPDTKSLRAAIDRRPGLKRSRREYYDYYDNAVVVCRNIPTDSPGNVADLPESDLCIGYLNNYWLEDKDTNLREILDQANSLR